MARITIEDCTEKVPNRFQLVQMAAIRSKQLKKGATALVKREENKEVVMSLREIAAGYVSPEDTSSVLEADSPAGEATSEIVEETSAPTSETENPSPS